ncbi:MAG: SBBP repeat-containing protein, partial [Armatimonadetes bacterium]|nr:SBBP repeat-containing protein [Armatimonadota bacterium]
LPGTTHYLRGNDSSKWLHDIPSYGKVRYSNVYKGIDLLYYGTQKQLEYDFVVKPHANPKQIHLRFDGVEKVKITPSGELSLSVAKHELKWRKPVAYQTIGGKRQGVMSRYVQDSNKQVSFEVARYDSTYPLVIDPVFLYSTFAGGSAEDECNDIAVDSNGTVYVAGTTTSRDFPQWLPTLSPHFDYLGLNGQSVGSDRTDYDAFVWQLDTRTNPNNITPPPPPVPPTITTVIYGSPGNDTANAIAIGTNTSTGVVNGSVYVTGRTDSKMFPSAAGTDKPINYFSGAQSAYVIRLDFRALPTIGWSMFLGGTGYDEGLDIAYRWNTSSPTLGNFGSIAIVGVTTSPELDISTRFPFQAKPQGGEDGFLTLWRDMPVASGAVANVVPTHYTYIGGIATDYLTTVAIDSDYNIVVGGYTNSTNFPVKNTTPSLSQPQGGYDGIVMRFQS